MTYAERLPSRAALWRQCGLASLVLVLAPIVWNCTRAGNDTWQSVLLPICTYAAYGLLVLYWLPAPQAPATHQDGASVRYQALRTADKWQSQERAKGGELLHMPREQAQPLSAQVARRPPPGQVPPPGAAGELLREEAPEPPSAAFPGAQQLQFWVNGKEHTLSQPSPSALLVDYLHSVGLTGTKVGCGEGGCGACTVALAPGPPPSAASAQSGGAAEMVPINSCLRLLCSVDGMSITTTEGLGSTSAGLHPIQEKIASGGKAGVCGTQCGYCTPGWVMSMHALRESTPSGELTPEAIEQHFDGNLCRCTGYRPILSAFQEFADADTHKEDNGGQRGSCRQLAPQPGGEGPRPACQGRARPAAGEHGLPAAHANPCGGANCDILDVEDCAGGARPCTSVCRNAGQCSHAGGGGSAGAAARALRGAAAPRHFVDPASGSEWFQPATLEQVWAAWKQAPPEADVAVVCANTGMGVAKYYTGTATGAPPSLRARVTIDIRHVRELQGVRKSAESITVGAAVPLGRLIAALEAEAPTEPVYAHVVRHLKRIGSVQIRSVGSWAGNLVLAKRHPAFGSDLVTVLGALGGGTQVGTASSALGPRTFGVEEFLTAQLQGDEVVTHCMLPRACSARGLGAVLYRTYKTAQRHVFAHAIVNAGFWVARDPSSGRVQEARVVLNGLCPQALFAHRTEAALLNNPLDSATLKGALAALQRDVEAGGGAGGDPLHTAQYKLALAKTFLYKVFLEAQPALSPPLRSAVLPFAAAEDRPVSSGSVCWAGASDPAEAPVGLPVAKVSARVQATGEAGYVSTHDAGGRGLHGALVYATAARRTILAIDPAPALALPGVRDFTGKADIPAKGSNDMTEVASTEPVFLGEGDEAPCVGAVVGLVVADTAAHARAGAKAVAVRYAAAAGGAGAAPVADLRAARTRGTHFTQEEIDAAMHHLPVAHPKGMHVPASWYAGHHARTNRAAVGPPAPLPPTPPRQGQARGEEGGRVGGLLPSGLSGVVQMGAQKHFYMENMACLVVPGEAGAVEVWCATQNPWNAREVLCKVLGLAPSQVTVRLKRIGGAFGGKLFRYLPLAAATAVAAHKLKVPVHAVNERVDDMLMTGGREPVEVDYNALYWADGTVSAANLHAHVDCGHFIGAAAIDVLYASTFADNVYHHAEFAPLATPYWTSTPNNSSCRAPGALQVILAHEVLIEHVAHSLGVPHHVIQEKNFYRPGDLSPLGVPIRPAAGDEENWTVPQLWRQLTQDCDWAARQAAVETFNQANRWRKRGIARQAVKYGIADNVYTNTAVVAIQAADGAVLIAHGAVEMGQGLSTKAIQVAAWSLGAPLEAISVADTDTAKVAPSTFTGASGTSECCAMAVKNACDTLAKALAPYRTAGASWQEVVAAASKAGVSLSAPGFYEDKHKVIEGMDNYSTFGVACSEVEVDALTGEVQVLRTDILMDLGMSLNPEVDVGQIQGGFVMALGYVLTEEARVDEAGHLLNLGTWEYKIPTAYDIPIEINVKLLPNTPNPTGVLGTKASAEPPLALVGSVFFAAKQAIYAARRDAGNTDYLPLPIPLTVQAIQQACFVTDDQFILS